MHRRTFAAVATTVALAGALLYTAPATADARGVETLLFGRINSERQARGKAALALHSGLLTQNQAHSQFMDSIDNLTHDGFTGRVDNAQPDPPEANGPKDDGFGAACEDIAFRSGPETDQVAANGLYTQWLNSPPHRECMFDETNVGYTAGAVGVYQDASGESWATLILVVDSTPPSGTTPSAPPSTGPSPTGPIVTNPPQPSSGPVPTIPPGGDAFTQLIQIVMQAFGPVFDILNSFLGTILGLFSGNLGGLIPTVDVSEPSTRMFVHILLGR